MTEWLFDFTSERWGAALLAFLPALLNAYILIYIFRKLDRNALTYTFAVTVFTLLLWQMHDTMMRLSVSEVTADIWTDLLWPISILVSPVSLHFAMLFTRNDNLAKNPLVLAVLYLPWVFFWAMTSARFYDHQFFNDETWGWTLMQTDPLGMMELYWLGALGIITLVLLSWNAYRCRHLPVKGMQALLIAVGFALPTVQAVVTQIVLPYMLSIQEIPVTSTFMTFFSLLSVVALRRYSLFQFSPEYSAEVIIDQMNDGLCAVSLEGHIQYVNPRLAQLTGFQQGKLVGRHLSSLFAEPEIIRHELEQQEQEKRPGLNETLQVLKHDGHCCPVRMTISSLRDDSGRLVGFIALLNDVSNLVEAEQRLKAKNKELGTFIYRTSHDLRGPLASLLGLAELSKDELRGGNHPQEYLQLIENTGHRLDGVLGELKEVGQVINHVLKVERISCEALVRQVWKELEQKWCDRPLQLIVDVRQEQDFYSDRKLVQTILMHLLENAVRFQNSEVERPYVKVQVQVTAGEVELTVTDNGIGISDEFIPMAGVMFSRGANGRSGNGLGLYIVRNALDRLQGVFQIQKQPNGGTKVKVELGNSLAMTN